MTLSMSLQTIVILGTLFSSIGFAIDKVLHKKDKKGLYWILAKFWLMLEDMRFPDIPRIISGKILKGFDYLFTPEKGFGKSLMRIILFSLAISCILSITGYVSSPNFQAKDVFILFMISSIILNILFDLFSILVTWKCLKVIEKGGPFEALGASILYPSIEARG